MRKRVGAAYALLIGVLGTGLVGWHVAAPASQDADSTVTAGSLPAAAKAPWGASGTKAPMPDASSLSSAVTQALAGHTGEYSVSVVDVATGKKLVDHDASHLGAPASSLKLLTGSAALATLGHDARFDTTAVLDGHEVWLTGGGDVLLGDGESKDDEVNGHAGLGTLAEETVAALKKQGITGQVKVGLDSSLFPGPGLNSNWASDLVTTNNITEVQTPAMYAGRANSDHHSAVVRNPASEARSTFLSRLQEAASTSGLDVDFVQGETWAGASDDAADSDSSATDGPSNPAKDAAASGDAASEAPSGKVIAKVSSSTVIQQLEYMENNSDNYLAEVYGRLVATKSGGKGTISGATSAVTNAVKKLGVDVTGLDMRDTSGLAATNQVSPATLAQLLAVTQTSSNADLRDLAPLLPVSGVSGTLSGRLTGTEAKGLVRAKTGTLADVISLSGFVTTKDGRLLSFSVMSSGVEGAQSDARAATDAVAEALLKG
jgi:D-alanyl-D-alanine carboxypeptidase/D-alanyl-D-alanine-endopeptidase (penicillin-binding protein 4)